MYEPGPYNSSAEAARMRSLGWSGIGNSAAARQEYEGVANDMDADRARYLWYQNYGNNLAHQYNMHGLASQQQDLQDRVAQREIMGREQGRREQETRSRYEQLRRSSDNTLAATREMSRGLQNMFGNGQGMLSGLLGLGQQSPPSTSMFGADGNRIGGSSYSRNYGGVRGGSVLSALGGPRMRLA